jgi:predicted transglutaminase-like cysteine proteinase
MSFRPGLFVQLFAVTLAAALPAGPAVATQVGTFMPDGDVADAPAGFEDMCMRDTALCNVGATPTPATPGKNYFAAASSLTPASDRSWSTMAWTVASGVSALGTTAENNCAAVTASIFMTNASSPFHSTVYQPLIVMPGNAFDVARNLAPDHVNNACAAVDRSNIGPVSAVPGYSSAPSEPAPEGEMKSRQQKKMIELMNAVVNHDVAQISDLDNYGVEERWQRPVAGRNPAGDCEDLAIEKRMRLIDAGFPSDRLFLAVAYRSRFGLHTVLVARLDEGDYVLDSLTRRVLPWSQVHYVWLRQQTIGNPRVWRLIGATPRGQEMVLKPRLSESASS